jgi:hypothetical protein
VAVNREEIIIDVDGAREAERDLDGVGKSFDGLTKNIASAAAGFLTFGAALKAVELAKAGAQLEQVDAAFARLGGTTEQVDATFQALGGTVDRDTIKRLTNTARALGITGDQFQQLSKVALASSKALGRDVTESLQDVVTGTARFSREILDNLGLQVSVGQANDAYAKSLGKTAAQLTDAEKKQAFFNAVLEAGSVLTEQVGANVEGAAGSFAALSSAAKEAESNISRFVAELGQDAVAAWVEVLGDAAVELGLISEITLKTLRDAAKFRASPTEAAGRGTPEKELQRAKANIDRLQNQLGLTDAIGKSARELRFELVEQGNAASINTSEFRELLRLKKELPKLEREAAEFAKEQQIVAEGEAEANRIIADIEAKRAELKKRRAKAAAAAAKAAAAEARAKKTTVEQVVGQLPTQESTDALAFINQLDAEADAAAELEQERMRLVAEGVEARIKSRRKERADFLAGQQAQRDSALEVLSAINAQAAAYARLGVSIDGAGEKVLNVSSIMGTVGVDALASIGSALGDAAVQALFYGESFSKALGNALMAAGASAIGFAISGAAIAGVMAVIPGMQAEAAALGIAAAAAAGAGLMLAGIGKAMGGDLNTGGLGGGGAGSAAGRSSPSETAERDLMRDRRRSRNTADQQEVTIIINNSLGGERVDRAIHRAAVRGARFDRPRRAGAM